MYSSGWLRVAICWPNAGKADGWRWMTESAADATTPIGKERRSSLAVSARRHCLQTTYLPVATASSRVDAEASRRCLHAAGLSVTTMRHVRTSPPAARRWRSSHPSVDLYVGVNLWTFFDVQGGNRLICRCTYTRVNMVSENRP